MPRRESENNRSRRGEGSSVPTLVMAAGGSTSAAPPSARPADRPVARLRESSERSETSARRALATSSQEAAATVGSPDAAGARPDLGQEPGPDGAACDCCRARRCGTRSAPAATTGTRTRCCRSTSTRLSVRCCDGLDFYGAEPAAVDRRPAAAALDDPVVRRLMTILWGGCDHRGHRPCRGRCLLRGSQRGQAGVLSGLEPDGASVRQRACAPQAGAARRAGCWCREFAPPQRSKARSAMQIAIVAVARKSAVLVWLLVTKVRD